MVQNPLIHTDTTHSPIVQFILHVDELDINPFRVNHLDIQANYIENITEHITISVMLADNIITKYILPNKNDIRCTLIYTNINTYRREFVALPYLDKVDDNTSVNDSDKQVSFLQFQLIQYDLKNLYNGVINGVFKSVKEIIDLLGEVEHENKTKLNYVLLEEPHNTRVYKQYMLKPTKPNELLTHLQKTVGVYNSTPTEFYTCFDKTLYVYPAYSLKDSKQKRFIVSVGNDSVYEDLKSTYAYDNNDKSTIRLLGNSFLFTNKRDTISKSLTNHYDAVDTDTLYDRPVNPDKFDSSKITRRAIQDKEAMYGNYIDPTNNLYKYRSLSAKGQGRLATCKWNRSNGMLIKPMSNVTVEYNNKTYTGKIISHYTYFDRADDSETCMLYMFLNYA